VTAYVYTRVDLAPGVSVTVDGNSKITLDDFYQPRPNAFSLPDTSTCPGSTETCRRSCYVHGLRRNAPDVYEAYRDNERVTHLATMSPGMHADTALAFGHWIASNCRSGFRWHVSGDVYSIRYARWIRDVCGWSPDVRHWIYTRTLEAVGTLTAARNLVVNVSADADNYALAREVADEYGLRLCYLATGDVPDLALDSVIFPDYRYRGRELDDPKSLPWYRALTAEQRRMVCPADFYGQSSTHRCGPCSRCLRKVGQ